MKLNKRQVLLVRFMLFSLFLGAGNRLLHELEVGV